MKKLRKIVIFCSIFYVVFHNILIEKRFFVVVEAGGNFNFNILELKNLMSSEVLTLSIRMLVLYFLNAKAHV
jgi:hypothetical protein